MTLKPPPLERIAEAIRDRELLDVRVVGEGVLPRVCPINLTVWEGHDDVTFSQEYVSDGDFHKAEYTFDAEDVMWLKPTICGISDVEPPRVRALRDLPDNEKMVQHVLDTVAFVYNRKVDDILNHRETVPQVRYLAMLLLYEVTNMSQHMIPQHFGYKSITPLHSALMEVGLNRRIPKEQEHLDRIERLRQAHELLETRVGRTLPFCRDGSASVLA